MVLTLGYTPKFTLGRQKVDWPNEQLGYDFLN